MSLILVVICLAVGMLIGAVGIGGVLLIPALTFVGDIGVHEAIPACMLSYLATGTIGAIVYARHGSIQWDKVLWLCLGAVPAAFIGSVSLLSIPAVVVMFLISILMTFAGVDALIKSFSSAGRGDSRFTLGRGHYVAIGFVTGFCSAITGTGGPLIIVPVIIFLGQPVLMAVGLSQAIQVPIATFASIGNWMAGNLNINLGLIIAAAMVAGSLAGAMLMHRLPTEPIRKFMAFLLVFVGVGIGLHQLFKLQVF